MHLTVKTLAALTAISLLAACPSDIVTNTSKITVDGKTYTVVTETERSSQSTYTRSYVSGPDIGTVPCTFGFCDVAVRAALENRQTPQKTDSPFEEESSRGD